MVWLEELEERLWQEPKFVVLENLCAPLYIRLNVCPISNSWLVYIHNWYSS